jgi:K(+)-stimulated pyrophosphate-energized sodium pump
MGHDPQKIPFTIVGYGFGASFVALFAQLGGGIYTKAADVGADLVGKVEAGIPEDDPRNPAVIADLVGDNVGDCAGRGADLFESTAAENIGAMILGVGLYPTSDSEASFFRSIARALRPHRLDRRHRHRRSGEEEDPMHALNRGYYVTSALAIVGFFRRDVLASAASTQAAHPKRPPPGCIFSFARHRHSDGQAFVYITQYYTEYQIPAGEIDRRGVADRPATNIITAIAVGLECTAIPVLVISAAIIASYHLGSASGVAHAGLFGTAVATMGMLGTAAYILAMDTFGPITDNAGGIVEMSQQPRE